MIGWAPGDLAVCVDASKHAGSAHPKPPLEEGRIYTVVDTVLGGLVVVEASCKPAPSFKAQRFRKIRPDAHEGSIEDWRDVVEFFTKRVSA